VEKQCRRMEAERNIQWMAMSFANSWVFQGGILDMFFQHIWKMISELLLYWIYTNSSNQFKPRVFFFCQRPDVDVVVHRRTWRWMDQGPKKMIGIWSDMALSGNRWNMMPIINPYRYCVWSVNDVWSSFYQSDPIRRFGPQELDNAWRSNWGVGARFPQRFSFLHAVTWRMSR
jgi:hypothetical protein